MATKVSQHQARIAEHYRQTTPFYQWFWSWGTHSVHAGFYDRHHRWPAQALKNTNKVLAKMAKITASDKVLDAGCGMGGSAVWLAKNIGAKVTGINISPEQLALARQLAREEGVENLVNFEKQDYCHTSFPDQSFDVVWALESVCHAENKQAFVKEAARLLRPGGRLMVSDGFLLKPRAQVHPFLLKLLKKFEAGYDIGELVSLNQFRSFLEGTGFKKVNFIDKSTATRPNWWLGFFICLICYLPVTILVKLHLLNRPALLRLGLTGILQPFGEILGVGRYGVFLAVKK